MNELLDLDAVEYVYKVLRSPKEALTPEEISYMTGRLEEFLRNNGYRNDSEPPPPVKQGFMDIIKKVRL